jgi:hypothetical protein
MSSLKSITAVIIKRGMSANNTVGFPFVMEIDEKDWIKESKVEGGRATEREGREVSRQKRWCRVAATDLHLHYGNQEEICVLPPLKLLPQVEWDEVVPRIERRHDLKKMSQNRKIC